MVTDGNACRGATDGLGIAERRALWHRHGLPTVFAIHMSVQVYRDSFISG